MTDLGSVERRPSPMGELVPARRLELRVGRAATDLPRLDAYVRRRQRTFSRAYLKERIRAGDVLVNGVSARASRRLRPGDVVHVLYGRNSDRPLVADEGELSILHEDDDLIVIDKPSGLVCQPRDRHIGGSLVNRLVAYLSAQAGGEYRPPLVVHRLDQDTSGVMVYARRRPALLDLANQFRRREVEKTYLAIVEGRPEQDRFTVDAPIGRDPESKLRREIRDDGKPSRTHATVVERYSERSLLSVVLETGRTHQIRLHLAHVGHPIVGDTFYGRASGRIGRQALHAHRIAFTHPVHGIRVVHEAPLPPDFAAAMVG